MAHARARSRFYLRLYQALTPDRLALRDLPSVTKPQLMAAFDDWVTDPRITRAGLDAFIADKAAIGTLFDSEFFVCTSAGTTGRPGLFVHDRRAIAVYQAINLARVTAAWFDVGQLWCLARGGFRWAAVLGTGGHYVGAAWLALEQRRGGWRSRAIRVFSVQKPLGELVAELQAFDPVMLTGYPSALDLLAGEQSAGRLALRPVTVELGGESLSPETDSRISAAFGCPVRNLYAASECQSIAYSCDRGWLHVNSDWVILEPVDEDMRPTLPGEFSHTVLLTNLANRVQPIIRYDLGDSVMVRPDPCPCGCPLPAIRVAGRRDDVLRLHDAEGRVVKIPPLAIGAVLDETPGVRRGQIIQTGPATIQLRLEREADADLERAWSDVTANLSAYLSAQQLANVVLVRSDEPLRHGAQFGKFRQVMVDSVNAKATLPP